VSAPAPAPDAAPGWRLEGEPAAVSGLVASVLADPLGVAARGEVLRRTAQRVVARVSLGAAGDVLLKVEHNTGLEEALLALVRPSRARMEWTAAKALHAAGVPVPRPLALAEKRALPGRRLTVYAARFVPGARSLLALLPRLSAEEARVLLGAAGALVRRMHDACFDHRDLHPGNLLVGPGGAGDLHVIDLHRGALGPVSESARRAALARLVSGLPAAALPARDVGAALLAGWLGSARADGAERLLDELAPHVRAFVRAREAKQDAWAFEESPWYVRERGPFVGVRAHELPADLLARRLADHDAALAAHDARVVKDRPKSAVTRHGDVVVKETRVPGLRGRLKAWFVPWRLVAGHVNAHRLRVRAIATARSRGSVEHAGRRFTLYEDLGRLPRLDDEARRLYPAGGSAERARLRDRLADWAADLHARGVYHGDWKALHMFVGTGGDGSPSIVLIDTDRVKFLRGPVGLDRRLRNLAQLHASIPLVVTRTERLRWWRRYAERLGVRCDERAAMARLAELLAAKRRVVFEALE
jgi:hypothetical protein